MENPLAFSLSSTVRVPNLFPQHEVPSYRLAIVGEAPGETEENYRIPFVGASGKLLDSILASVGIQRSSCFIGNVCKYRPPGNDIKEWGFSHTRVQEGWAELQDDLRSFAPNAILALGNTPLHFLCAHSGITSWRGSILQSAFGKVIPAIHPAAVLREYKDWVLVRFDSQRARAEAETPVLSLPTRTLELSLSADEICNRLDNWPTGALFSFDIEGGLDAFPCCSVAGSSDFGFIIAWSKFSERDQGRIAVSLSRALYNESIPKVLQNSLYDRFVLAYGYRMLIRGVVEDTMLKQWEIYPELPKGLGTIASIWTREPYYKADRKTDNPDTFYEYCIKDSCVTLEACLAQSGALSSDARRHYDFNVSLLSPLLYMELRGIEYDNATARNELGQVQTSLAETATRLELRAGYSLNGKKGSISATKLKKCLYHEKGYPEQKTSRGADAKVTTDVEALLHLQKKFPNDAFLADILLHRKLESIQETLEIQTDPDGRVRCGYNLVGTETGRLTCYTSPTGSGANLQTITKKLRKLYRADNGYWMFQCDLSGADGWTVAARCREHGDSTMWDDYTYGLKPALIIVLLYQGLINNSTPRDVLKELSSQYKQWEEDHESESWLYFACKRVQHASNYGVQWKTGCAQIMKDSYKLTGKPVYIEKGTFESLQRLYYSRYPGIYQWHQWAKRMVMDGQNLKSASGHTRTFFGRRQSWDTKSKTLSADHETWKEFLADEPQENTTYAIKLALHRLWHDRENRRPVEDIPAHLRHNFDSLYIEPLHTVHDSLNGQFPQERASWSVGKIREWFQNTLRIANTDVVIPFEGAYGPSWGELGAKYGGGSI